MFSSLEMLEWAVFLRYSTLDPQNRENQEITCEPYPTTECGACAVGDLSTIPHNRILLGYPDPTKCLESSLENFLVPKQRNYQYRANVFLPNSLLDKPPRTVHACNSTQVQIVLIALPVSVQKISVAAGPLSSHLSQCCSLPLARSSNLPPGARSLFQSKPQIALPVPAPHTSSVQKQAA